MVDVKHAIEAAHDRVDHNMTNHTPPIDGIQRIEVLRDSFRECGHLIVDLCPQSREQSVALTELETSLMWAVAAIARERT